MFLFPLPVKVIALQYTSSNKFRLRCFEYLWAILWLKDNTGTMTTYREPGGLH
jgi:hypothetical protein